MTLEYITCIGSATTIGCMKVTSIITVFKRKRVIGTEIMDKRNHKLLQGTRIIAKCKNFKTTWHWCFRDGRQQQRIHRFLICMGTKRNLTSHRSREQSPFFGRKNETVPEKWGTLRFFQRTKPQPVKRRKIESPRGKWSDLTTCSRSALTDR